MAGGLHEVVHEGRWFFMGDLWYGRLTFPHARPILSIHGR